MYTVLKEKPIKAFESLGAEIDLANRSSNALDNVIKICQEHYTHINNAKCSKTSCLNAFMTSFMPTLPYRMIAT